MDVRWDRIIEPNQRIVEALSKAINVNQYLSSVLVQRNINDYYQAKEFFRPSLKNLHNPFLMLGLDKAVDRLNDAIFKREKILIYGDYDVDGTTAVALCYNFLIRYYTNIEIYIPDRYEEGYGISEKGINWAHEKGFGLIMALDCGIKAHNESKLAKNLDIDLIICDHHMPGKHLPEAYAILDPKQPNDPYPFKELSGCGVGFKLMQGFAIQNTIEVANLFKFLDLLAVSIAADIVPIIDENRIMAYHGLNVLNNKPSPGLNALKDIAGIKGKIDISNIVFGIAPRINAAGRINHASNAVDLLVSKDCEDAHEKAKEINKTNNERRTFDLDTTMEALSLLEEENTRAKRSTVLFNKNWHKGIIGIVASRCIEHYYKPTIILTESKSMATGSARSVEGFDLYSALSDCSDLLKTFGGHKFAAGLTLEIDKIDEFKERFEQIVSERITREQMVPRLVIDCDLPLSVINFRFLNILKQMQPFGPGNMSPVFASNNIQIVNDCRVLKDKHIKFLAKQADNPIRFEVIGFNLWEKFNNYSDCNYFDIAYHIEENIYNGNKSIVLNLKDIKPAENSEVGYDLKSRTSNKKI